ncbi:MAG: LysR family transcriptional regulator [Methanobacteriota archaeon]|nr:MAG: LysR family transcriptional regulator [Euryarchaeota archaeon]
MDLVPRVVLVTENGEITNRQLEALAAVRDMGSMKKAAASLGISAPVLYKYVKEAESRCDETVVRSDSRGTKLTPFGEELLNRLDALRLRTQDRDSIHVAGTLVSELCLLSAASALARRGIECRVTISTDKENLRLMDEQRVDCVILDDPLRAMELAEKAEGVEIGTDLLLMRRSGKNFIRLAFGAQRLGFRYLEQEGIEFHVSDMIFEPALLDRTELSYFVNRSLVRRGILSAKGALEQGWSTHAIMALSCSDHDDNREFLAQAMRAGIYPKG